MSALTLTGAEVLGPVGLNPEALTIYQGRIAHPMSCAREIRLPEGCIIVPGIVDIHGDGFERHLAPRRGVVTDLAPGLGALEAELAANGITTAVLAQFWSWEGGMRSPDFAVKLAEALSQHPARCDLRLQLRVEVGCFEAFDAVFELIERHEIGYVVLNDHLPHDRLAQGRPPPRLQGQALKSGRSPDAHHALLRRLHAQMPQAHAAVAPFCEALQAIGVRLGSHDDQNAIDRAEWRARGAQIAEFPVTHEAAQGARLGGDGIILGAPNLLRGGSHKGGGHLNAAEMVALGLCDALASDYHYPAPFAAMHKLHAQGHPLHDIWGLVAAGPAQLLGLQDRGWLTPGARADLIVTDRNLDRIEATLSAGRVTWIAGTLADQLLAGDLA